MSNLFSGSVELNDWRCFHSQREFSNSTALQHSSNSLHPDQRIICHCPFLFLQPERWFQDQNIWKSQSLVGVVLFFLNRLRSSFILNLYDIFVNAVGNLVPQFNDCVSSRLQ